jgi:hypothetical protein
MTGERGADLDFQTAMFAIDTRRDLVDVRHAGLVISTGDSMLH